MHYLQKLNKNEQGMAAIVITMVLMIVISLIVLGFAQVTRREQRQALDRQLVTQAFYAAESGINLAQSRVAEYLNANPGADAQKSTCPIDGIIIKAGDYDIDPATGTAITCLLISSDQTSLKYQDVNMQSIVANVESEDIINQLVFSWQATSGANPSGCPNPSPAPLPLQPATARNCNQPLLRVDVVPMPATLDQSNLQAQQFTRFFYPVNSGGVGSADYSVGRKRSALPVSVNCINIPAAPNPYKCTARVTGLAANRYGVRVQAIYGSATLDIGARGSGVGLLLINGQFSIDSTAKANDILRRVQTRVSSSSSIVPDFGLTAGGAGLCKRYTITGTAPVAISSPAPGC